MFLSFLFSFFSFLFFFWGGGGGGVGDGSISTSVILLLFLYLLFILNSNKKGVCSSLFKFCYSYLALLPNVNESVLKTMLDGGITSAMNVIFI